MLVGLKLALKIFMDSDEDCETHVLKGAIAAQEMFIEELKKNINEVSGE
jgi:hypothetical protein